jgi:uroporphyrinogen decarboxylase
MTAPPHPASDSPLIHAAKGLPTPRVPVWFMRQAGRSLPEYRAIREGTGMLEACMTPDLIVEITLQPVRRYGVDAAIFFSDIVLPLKAMGVDLDIVAGVGPVIASPVTDLAGVAAIPDFDPEQVSFVAEAVSRLAAELGPIPLIGFAGAPYTLASYLIEGGPSKDHIKTKAMMHGAPDVWNALMAKLASIAAGFLRVQVDAGASAVQLFDSWAGDLSPTDYRAKALPYSTQVFSGVADLDVPRIHFGVATGELLADMATAGVEVMGVDWRVPLDQAVNRIQPHQAVQGNLDSTVVFAPWEVIETKALDVIKRGRAASGHIFNLGHGVLPGTDPDVLARLVDLIHSAEAEPEAPVGH